MLAWYGLRNRSKAEQKDYKRRDEQSFIDRFSNALSEEYGVGVKKQHRQQRKKEK